ncbi:MAG: tRNA 4-thiouridine(8) synthase ThiI, partial [Ignavibacteriae bacterium]|nr:tRNA 4-thiouridine(8) synthase ThiI [Ignavibacteriota bacterium]
IRTVLIDLIPLTAVRGGYGRFVIELDTEQNFVDITKRLLYIFGIANICVGVKVEQDVDAFCGAAENLLADRQFKTIKVDTRRPDKNFPLGSLVVNAKVGEYICKRFGVRANLSEPEETIFIEIVDGVAYVYRSKVKGAGGLPVGVSGNVVSLISAGFDSPVASWQMLKRGANVIFVHFHSMPYTSQNSVDQVRQLVEVLTRYQFNSTLHLVPFAEVQNEIVLQASQSLRVILYRRMMVRIAEAIAHREKAEALVSGEAVGQVASQTLRNIRVINEAATLPILRPLSGMDKEETMAAARQIGTYDISKEPYDDCCSFLAPRKPETWASLDEVNEAEKKFHVQSLVQMALEKTSSESFQYPQAEVKLKDPIDVAPM